MTAQSRMTVVQKICIGLVVSMVVVLVGATVWLELSKPGIGAPCEQHVECRNPERQCLRISSYQPAPIDPAADPLTRSVNEMTNEIFDPLAPNKDTLRQADTVGGYCTEACQRDDDCPDTMTCGEVMSFRSSVLGPDWIDGKGTKIRLCMMR